MKCIIEEGLKKFLEETFAYKVPKVKKLSENMSGTIYFASDLSEQKIIIKILNKNNLCGLYGFNNQNLVDYVTIFLQILSNLPLSISSPRIISVNHSMIHSYGDLLFYLTEYSPGQCKDINDLVLTQKLDMAKILSKIHQTDIPHYGSSYWEIKTKFMANIWNNFLNNNMGTIIEEISPQYIKDESFKHFIRKVCLTVTAEHILFQGSNICLSHSDIKPKNVLWDENGNYTLIDWEDVCLCRPEIELIDTITSWSIRKNSHDYFFIQDEAIEFINAYGLPLSITELDILISAAKWMVWIASCYHLKKIDLLKDAFLMTNLIDKNYNNLLSL